MKSLIKRANLIGLSAPQVGIPLQIFVIDFPYPSKHFSKEEIIIKEMQHINNQVMRRNINVIKKKKCYNYGYNNFIIVGLDKSRVKSIRS